MIHCWKKNKLSPVTFALCQTSDLINGAGYSFDNRGHLFGSDKCRGRFGIQKKLCKKQKQRSPRSEDNGVVRASSSIFTLSGKVVIGLTRITFLYVLSVFG